MPDRQWKRRVYGESWSTGDTYNAIFGQGYVTVTPLQLITAVAAIINDGMYMQPTLVQNFQNANGEIVREFEPQVQRTLMRPPDGEPMTLFIQEDMLLQGANSLACRCEPDSEWYDLNRCNPDTYTSSFDLYPDEDDGLSEWIDYRVHVPYGFDWATSGICEPIVFQLTGRSFIPPIATAETIGLVQQGGREVVSRGTASEPANPSFPPLGYVTEGGKTGTAEYCDDVARPQGLCIPGQWPSHAWYVGYAPVDDPEIMVIAFVYNGGEGSQRAMPIVREVMNFYFQNKSPITNSSP
jgi:membrane carboxypeptidase/penicillin-binding protein